MTEQPLDAGAGDADLLRVAAALGDRYEVIRELGQGGMAVVYLARDGLHDRPVAVKVLRRELAALLGPERFLREIRITASLQHPNVLPLFESGDAEGLLYYTMPFVEGESLRDRLNRESQLPLAAAIAIATDVASALAHAHERGVIHRDVKPENVLLSSGKGIVADFGVARAIAAAGGDRVTSAGLAVGTPAYMSPEQAAGSPNLDGRCDVYALGCVVFEMLAGQPPFTSHMPQVVMAQQVQERPPSLTVFRPDLPAAVVGVVERALAKSAADRFQTATEFAEALSGAATGLRAPVGHTRFRVRPIVAVAAPFLLALATWLLWPHASLASDRVVVFPLATAAGSTAGDDGWSVATYIGHALEGSEPLRWIEGSDLTRAAGGSATEAPPVDEMRRLTRRAGAASYVDGAVLRESDSVIVILRLHRVASDTGVLRASRSGPRGSSAAALAARAVGDLMPALLAPGRRVDVAPLADRRPAAIAQFLEGERAYRRAEFGLALERYTEAVGHDSLLALAAVKGAQAAAWLERHDAADALIAAALGHRAGLPRRYAAYAEGLAAYLRGAAELAARHFEEALALSPGWPEAAMARGEVFYHLLPAVAGADTIANTAFAAAHAGEPDFAAPVFHLTELAVQRGDRRAAERFADGFGALSSDSGMRTIVAMLVGCASGDLDSAGWARESARATADALEAAKVLSSALPYGACAIRGAEAVLRTPGATRAQQFAAFQLLHHMLVRAGDAARIREIVASPDGRVNGGDYFVLLSGLVDTAYAADAARIAEEQGREFRRMGSLRAWMLGTWHATRGNAADAAEAAAALRAKADSTHSRADSLLSRIVSAHARLAAGDSGAAIMMLRRLQPAAPLTTLGWSVFEPLGFERLTLARLLEARGDHADAELYASLLDAPQPAAYVLYERAAVELRLRIARASGAGRLERDLAARLTKSRTLSP